MLSQLGVQSFEPLLAARARAIGALRVCIDGGAGWGDTSRVMLAHTAPDGILFAFEPFTGNHRFWQGCDPRIRMSKCAVADRVGSARFLVAGIVKPGDAWAGRDLVGYSSIGHLAKRRDSLVAMVRTILASVVKASLPRTQVVDVNVTRIDQVVPDIHIDFLKLDIQGAEYEALLGMGGLLAKTDMLWVEFTGQSKLLDLLVDRGFVLFDTNYLCRETSVPLLDLFGLRITQRITLSTSQVAILAMRVSECRNYGKWFSHAKAKAGVMQTDLLAVNKHFLPHFLRVLGELGQTLRENPAVVPPG